MNRQFLLISLRLETVQERITVCEVGMTVCIECGKIKSSNKLSGAMK